MRGRDHPAWPPAVFGAGWPAGWLLGGWKAQHGGRWHAVCKGRRDESLLLLHGCGRHPPAGYRDHEMEGEEALPPHQAETAPAVQREARGGDVNAGLAPGEAQQAAAGEATAAVAAPPAGGSEPGAEELYGDLGPTLVPQVDGAADSPPRRSHHRGADPAERWEMGRDSERGCGPAVRCVPVGQAACCCWALIEGALVPTVAARRLPA